jgi:hypothetical protein
LLTFFLVRDTQAHVQAEAALTSIPLLRNIWKDTTWRHANLGSVTLNGFVNNMNDGILWGLLPVLLSTKGYSLTETGFLAGIYPVVGAGAAADRKARRSVLQKTVAKYGHAAAGHRHCPASVG